MSKLKKSPNNFPSFKAENVPSDYIRAAALSPFSMYTTAANRGGVYFGGWCHSRNSRDWRIRGHQLMDILDGDPSNDLELFKKIIQKERNEYSLTFGDGLFIAKFYVVEAHVPKTDYTVRILESRNSSDEQALMSRFWSMRNPETLPDHVRSKASALNEEFLSRAATGLLGMDRPSYVHRETSVVEDRVWIAVRSDDPNYVYLDQQTTLVAPDCNAPNPRAWFLVKPGEMGDWILPLAAWTRVLPANLMHAYSKILEGNLFANQGTLAKVQKLVIDNFQVKENERNPVEEGRQAERAMKELVERTRMENAEFARLKDFSEGKLQKIRIGGWKISYEIPIKELPSNLVKTEPEGQTIDTSYYWEVLRRNRIRVHMENPHTKITLCPWYLSVDGMVPKNQNALERVLFQLSRGWGEGALSAMLRDSLLGRLHHDPQKTPAESIQENVENLNLDINGIPIELEPFSSGGIKFFGKRIRKEDLVGVLESCMCFTERSDMVSLAEDCSELSLDVRQKLTDGLRFHAKLPVFSPPTVEPESPYYTRNQVIKAGRRVKDRYENWDDIGGVTYSHLVVELPLERNTTGKNRRLKLAIPLPGNRKLLVRLKFLKKLRAAATRWTTSMGSHPELPLIELFEAEAFRNGLDNYTGSPAERYIFRRALLKGAAFYKVAIRRSEQLLREACEELEAETAEHTVEGKTVTGYSITGTSGNEYFVSSDRPYRIFQKNGNRWNFLCVVGNAASDGVGKDELVTRLFALKNDTDSAEEVHTLSAARQ